MEYVKHNITVWGSDLKVFPSAQLYLCTQYSRLVHASQLANMMILSHLFSVHATGTLFFSRMHLNGVYGRAKLTLIHFPLCPMSPGN